MTTRYRIGTAEIDLATRKVKRGEVTTRLSPKATRVLRRLMQAGGDVVSRDDLLEAAWSGAVVVEEVLTHAMAELRRGLGDDFRSPRIFQTIHKSGYRLLVRPQPLDAAEPDPPPATDAFTVDGYTDYLKALELFEAGGGDNLQAAVSLLETVTRESPQFAPAHALLAITGIFSALYYGGGGDERDRAREAGSRALALDARGAEANTAYGFLRSVEDQPQQALQFFARALQADPRSIEAHKLLGRVLFALGDYERAGLMLGRTTRLQPDQYHLQVVAAKALHGSGQEAAALARLRCGARELELHADLVRGEWQAICDRIYFQLSLGDIQAGLEGIEQVWNRCGGQLYYPATGLARAGMIAESLDCLEACVQAGWSHREWLMNDPDLAILQSEPRFRRLHAEMATTD